MGLRAHSALKRPEEVIESVWMTKHIKCGCPFMGGRDHLGFIVENIEIFLGVNDEVANISLCLMKR